MAPPFLFLKAGVPLHSWGVTTIAIMALFAVAASPPVEPPLPENRPEVGEDNSGDSDGDAPVAEPSPGGAAQGDEEMDADPVKKDSSGEPGDEEKDDEGEGIDPESTEESDAEEVARDGPEITEDPTELKACLSELQAIGAVFSKSSPLIGKGGCGITDPVSVELILPGVTLEPQSQMRCKTALALARWTRDFVKPATVTLGEDVRLTGINHASTFVCRRRNNRPDGKFSEHSFGNAIDISGFEFEGNDPIPVEPRADTGTPEEAFQRAARATACLLFSTVIGPGTDESHATHLHFDVIERNGGYRICQ